MNIKPIKTKKDYENALKEIERLFDAKPNTPNGDRLEVLTALVEAYEEQHFPIDIPDPVDALNYWIESRGLERKDLEPYIGARGRISEILNRKRGLSLTMIRELNEHLHIPAEVLIKKPILQDNDYNKVHRAAG
jgi:HTH-type transcriptional regulator/antitoxin HigA